MAAPDALQEEITRELLSRFAPAEAPFADQVLASLAADGTAPEKDEPLAFVPESIALLMTPVIWSTAGAVLTHVARTLFDGSADLAKEAVRQRLLEKKSAPGATPVSLDGKLVVDLQDVARAEARRLGLDAENSRLLADAVVGALVARQARRSGRAR